MPNDWAGVSEDALVRRLIASSRDEARAHAASTVAGADGAVGETQQPERQERRQRALSRRRRRRQQRQRRRPGSDGRVRPQVANERARAQRKKKHPTKQQTTACTPATQHRPPTTLPHPADDWRLGSQHLQLQLQATTTSLRQARQVVPTGARRWAKLLHQRARSARTAKQAKAAAHAAAPAAAAADQATTANAAVATTNEVAAAAEGAKATGWSLGRTAAVIRREWTAVRAAATRATCALKHGAAAAAARLRSWWGAGTTGATPTAEVVAPHAGACPCCADGKAHCSGPVLGSGQRDDDSSDGEGDPWHDYHIDSEGEGDEGEADDLALRALLDSVEDEAETERRTDQALYEHLDVFENAAQGPPNRAPPTTEPRRLPGSVRAKLLAIRTLTRRHRQESATAAREAALAHEPPSDCSLDHIDDTYEEAYIALYSNTARGVAVWCGRRTGQYQAAAHTLRVPGGKKQSPTDVVPWSTALHHLHKVCPRAAMRVRVAHATTAPTPKTFGNLRLFVVRMNEPTEPATGSCLEARERTRQEIENSEDTAGKGATAAFHSISNGETAPLVRLPTAANGAPPYGNCRRVEVACTNEHGSILCRYDGQGFQLPMAAVEPTDFHDAWATAQRALARASEGRLLAGIGASPTSAVPIGSTGEGDNVRAP